jgi:hypothetical protein
MNILHCTNEDFNIIFVYKVDILKSKLDEY